MKCFCILVDALNPIYLAYMPGLARLMEGGTGGRLREPLGFTPREAYFGGLSPNQAGHTHMFEVHVDGSFNPFSLAAEFPPHLRLQLDTIQQYVQPSFGSHYAKSLNIPWELLPRFALSEPYSPWDHRKGYRSLFDELHELHRSWSYIGWPFHQEPDEALARRAGYALEQGTDFVFLHLSELDSVGHAHGPHSHEAMITANKLDALITSLLRLTTNQNLLIFGDHGMVPVIRHIRLDLSWLPTGALHFVDSTSVRIWTHQQHHALVRERMQRVDGIFELSPDKLACYQAEQVPNGLVFWAKPGCVLTPNFFGATPLQGMHGYLPEVFDNESLFILSGSQIPPQTVDTINATQIYALLKGQLGLAPMPELPRAKTGRYSRIEGGDEIASKALGFISEILNKEFPMITGLHLSGSFGRGEGTVKNGRLVNDLDFVYEADEAINPDELKAVAERIRDEIGLSFIDFSRPPPVDSSQYDHDFRHGSQTIFGDPASISERAMVAGNDIAPVYFDRLVLNRIAGLLSADCLPYRDDEDYRQTQVVKLGIALTQRLLAGLNAYHQSYYICLRRLDLLPESLRPSLRLCLENKLEGGWLEASQLSSIVDTMRSHLSDHKVIRLPKGLRSRIAWRHARIYRRLHRAFMRNTQASPELIQAWFKIIHP